MINDIFSLFNLRDSKEHLYLSCPRYAYAIYKDKKINLLTHKKTQGGFTFLNEKLKTIKVNSEVHDAKVFHLYYELGFLYENLDSIDSSTLLAIIIEYNKSEKKIIQQRDTIQLSIKEGITLKEYSSKFNLVQRELNSGNCYQLNLTKIFKFSFKNLKAQNFINSLFSKKDLSAFAHATYIGSLDSLILSNSPECLFTIKGDEIATMPIKGTANQDKLSWEKLKASKKDEGELFMITDLMRNDLTRIALTPSKVRIKKAKLKVPKIWHQHSLISTKLPNGTNLYNIVSKIFPGGSITGAPKKNAMKLLSSIEKQDRGIYCGSTILMHKSLKAASINIRTAQIDFKTGILSYGSGGGVTLLSETNSEYEEMLLKLESFLSILN